jgi:hypothetical protein
MIALCHIFYCVGGGYCTYDESNPTPVYVVQGSDAEHLKMCMNTILICAMLWDNKSDGR